MAATLVRYPWPGMMRTVYGDPDRFRRTYWEHIPPRDGQYLYFAGDGARRDADGYFWHAGRADDMLTIRGIYGREMYETWYKMTVMLQSGLDIKPVMTGFQPRGDIREPAWAGEIMKDYW